MIVQAKRNVFEGQKNEMMKKIEHDDKLCHRKKLASLNILERSGATKFSIRSRNNRHERRRNRQIAKSREHCYEKNLESTKVAAQVAIRGEIGMTNMKARIARSRILYP